MNFPGRKSLAITMVLSTVMMITALLFTNAHNSPLDELGCHKDPPQGKYHCHTGALKGKEFADKEDAERAIAAVHAANDEADFQVTGYDEPAEATVSPEVSAAAASPAPTAKPAARGPASEAVASTVGDKLNLPPPPEPAKAVVNQNLLKIVSWKVKKREKMDVDRIANVLAEVDLAVLHDLDLDEVGRGPLHKMGDLLQSRIGEKICRMWFKNASGGKEKIGILWRNSTVSHVDNGGSIKGTCGEMAVIVPTNYKKGERGLATSMFFSKVQKKMFMLGTANFDSKPGNLPAVFKNVEASTWPTIVVGDLKTSNVADLKKTVNFKAALNGKRGKKSSTENVFTKNAIATRALPIDLHERFSEVSARELDTTVSDSFPILAEVELVAESDSAAAMTVVPVPEKKGKKKDKEAPKAKVVSEAKPATESFEEPSDDLEAEAKIADGGDKDKRAPAAAKSAAKKKTKKKKR